MTKPNVVSAPRRPSAEPHTEYTASVVVDCSTSRPSATVISVRESLEQTYPVILRRGEQLVDGVGHRAAVDPDEHSGRDVDVGTRGG